MTRAAVHCLFAAIVASLLLFGCSPRMARPTGGFPTPIELALSPDFHGLDVMYVGRTNETTMVGRSERMRLVAGRGLVGASAAYAHFEEILAKVVAERCENGASVLLFLGVPERRSWVFLSGHTLRIERNDGEVWVATSVFRVLYRYQNKFLEPEIQEVGLDQKVELRLNDVETDFESRDLSRFNGAAHSPLIVGDDRMIAFFAVIPARSLNGKEWPERSRDPFKLRLIPRAPVWSSPVK